MARDYVEILKRVEAFYPAAVGGAQHDDNFRSMLVPWTNDVIRELNQMQRWSNAILSGFFTTSPSTDGPYMVVGTDTPTVDWTGIKRVWYISATGAPVFLDKRERSEATRIFGDHTLGSSVTGSPRFYTFDYTGFTVFPSPDNAGPQSGNYQIYVEGYQPMHEIVETTGTINSGTSVLTIPATQYITDVGTTNLASVSVRGAGAAQFAGVNATFISSALTFTPPTTVNLVSLAPNSVTTAQTFFYSTPWLITYYPKTLLFALLRECAAYTGSSEKYQLFEQRYQNELTLMRAYEFDRSRTLDMKASAHVGQETAEERRLDVPVGLDVRGQL